ncbi:hypothetical protein pb186bvf_019095 [Paramecium bursaria]
MIHNQALWGQLKQDLMKLNYCVDMDFTQQSSINTPTGRAEKSVKQWRHNFAQKYYIQFFNKKYYSQIKIEKATLILILFNLIVLFLENQPTPDTKLSHLIQLLDDSSQNPLFFILHELHYLDKGPKQVRQVEQQSLILDKYYFFDEGNNQVITCSIRLNPQTQNYPQENKLFFLIFFII